MCPSCPISGWVLHLGGRFARAEEGRGPEAGRGWEAALISTRGWGSRSVEVASAAPGCGLFPTPAPRIQGQGPGPCPPGLHLQELRSERLRGWRNPRPRASPHSGHTQGPRTWWRHLILRAARSSSLTAARTASSAASAGTGAPEHRAGTAQTGRRQPGLHSASLWGTRRSQWGPPRPPSMCGRGLCSPALPGPGSLPGLPAAAITARALGFPESWSLGEVAVA